MSEDDLTGRRLNREELLKLAAVAGGAGLVAGRAGVAGAARAHFAAESGRLQVLDWAGYGNDGGQAMFAQYVKQHPNNKPQFTYMTNEADALAKIHAGLKPDLFRPYVGWVKYFATSGLVQPWDTSLIPNFKHLNPFMVKAGQYNGKQYGIPDDWGFDAILYRTDKVKPKSNSWWLLFDERYKGKIAWFDDPVENLTIAGLLPRFKDPWNQTDAELQQSQKFLISKKHLVRLIWSSETNLWQAFGSGDVWIALRVAQRLGADEEEEAEGRLHAPEGEADRLGRHVHAATGDAALAPRPRLRRRLELGEVGEVARGQLRLRPREHGGAAGVERPAAGAAADQPEGRHGAERPPRPRHPAAGGLREDLGRGEGLLTTRRRKG